MAISPRVQTTLKGYSRYAGNVQLYRPYLTTRSKIVFARPLLSDLQFTGAYSSRLVNDRLKTGGLVVWLSMVSSLATLSGLDP